MKALFYNSKKIGEVNILWGLIEIGINTDRSDLLVDLDLIYEDQVEMIVSEIREYDFVITRNFSVNVAEACHISNIPYISWSYDSPLKALYCKEARYNTNYIFAFDKEHLAKLKKMGLPNVYYQPLAANIIRAGQVSITEDDLKRYACDVSFVGGMYAKNYYEAFKEGLNDKQISECEDLFNTYLCKWSEKENIFNKLSDGVINAMYSQMSKKDREYYSISDRYLIELLVLVIELTSRERITLLNKAGELFDTVIHTYEPERFKGHMKAKILGPVEDMSDELFRIYAAARINLNISMRSIETGVPQRVYDIMSVGGCVFSNYQQEAVELFEPDREIVVFRNIEEFVEKADYYIKHEEKRLELGARAYIRVRDQYNYANAVRNMISKL